MAFWCILCAISADCSNLKLDFMFFNEYCNAPISMFIIGALEMHYDYDDDDDDDDMILYS